MRKRAKGSEPSAPDPFPPRPEDNHVERQKGQPQCLRCGVQDARVLSVPGVMFTPEVFCSLECAALYGMAHLGTTKLTWCKSHQRWTNELGRCAACCAEKQAANPVACGVKDCPLFPPKEVARG